MTTYRQTKDVSWLKTPKDTIWVDFMVDEGNHYIQPKDENLRETPFGVDLDLMDFMGIVELFEELDNI